MNGSETATNAAAPAPGHSPKSWYPVCRASDLARGGIRPFQLNGRDWVVFRKADGELGAVSRFCSHMGADLSNGRVRGDELQCPLHAWRFASDGRCTHVPVDENIPDRARLASLPVAEAFGIILVFTNPVALFHVPLIESLRGMPHSRVASFDVPVPCVAVALNTFDMQHFRHVHNREIVSEPKVESLGRFALGVTFVASVIPVRWHDRLLRLFGMREMEIVLECHGGNLLLMQNPTTGVRAFFAMTPTANGMQAFVVTVAGHRATSLPGRMLQALSLAIARRFIVAFLRPDVAALRNIRLREGTLLENADATVRRFWQFWRSLPADGDRHAPG